MLCYRCGSHNPDGTEACSHCGQPLGGAAKAGGANPSIPPRRRAISADEAPFPPGQVLAERYELREYMGPGPVGWVYRAEDREVGGEVALKLIRPRLLQTADERAQFLASIRTGRQFSHPQLARVYEEGQHGDHLFFTAPYLGGRTLRSVLMLKRESGQAFPLQEALPLLAQIATALAAAHAVGVHGDVKPENIFLLPDVLKLTDFGLALGIPREPFVQAQRGFKHEAYFSPEYVAGTELDVRADVYALGVLMGELLGNVVPEGSIPSLRHANPALPLAVNGLYRRALNESRDARPQTPGELVAELTQLVDNLEKASFDFPPAPPPDAQAPPSPEREPLPPPVPETSIAQETELVSEEDLVRQIAPSPARERRTTAQWPGAELPTLERPLSPRFRSGEKRRRNRRAHSLSVLLWIALVGLGLGAAGGWFLLERLRSRMLPPPRPEAVQSGARLEAPAPQAVTRGPPRAEPEPTEAQPTEAEPTEAAIQDETAEEAAAPTTETNANGSANGIEPVGENNSESPATEGSQLIPPSPRNPHAASDTDAVAAYVDGAKDQTEAPTDDQAPPPSHAARAPP